MKNFSDFIKEEITIRGNSGIPGEENKSEPGYLSDVDRKGREKVGRIGDPRPLFSEIMNLMQRGNSFIDGNETKFEELAEEMIRSIYSGILDNVDLDIKIVKSGSEIANFMQEESEDEDEGEKLQPSKDKDLKKEVDKRKIANNIIQGEAKNTKLIIELQECRDGLKKILGDQKGEEYHKILIDISKIADKLDWIIPIDVKANMLEVAPEGMAGAVSVKWPEAKEKEKEAEDILKKMEDGSDLEENKEELSELFSEGNPIIKARGIDFAMLIHECVKGIYELISAAGIPKDEKIARNVLFNTSSFADEAEDFRYGPFIAADLRDFINKNPKIDSYPNIREYVFGKLIEMDAEKFLITIKGILMNTPESRKLVDELVDLIIKELDEYEESVSDYESEKSNDIFSSEEGDDLSDLDTPKSNDLEDLRNKEVDYSKMSQIDLNDEINNALDDKDYERVKMLSQYLREGKEVYLKELERINESHSFHTRRK